MGLGPDFVVPEHELEFRASRSGGPGGQHVNTSSTRVEVRWNVSRSAALDPAGRERLLSRLGARLDAAGWLRVVSSETRSQTQNRDLARARLIGLVQRALTIPKVRRKTRTPKRAKEERLQAKRQRSAVKTQRRRPGPDD